MNENCKGWKGRVCSKMSSTIEDYNIEFSNECDMLDVLNKVEVRLEEIP
jgi:hypothetical protein